MKIMTLTLSTMSKMSAAEYQASRTKKGAKQNQGETQIQLAISKYIQTKYPDVIFTAESSGVRVNMGIAMKMKRQRSKGKHVDMIISEPRGIFHGLFLELKDPKYDPWMADFKKRKLLPIMRDGKLYFPGLKRDFDNKEQECKNQAQATMLWRLQDKGYKAQYAVGIQEAMEAIDYYMSLPINYQPSPF
jgi:hypothetical protein